MAFSLTSFRAYGTAADGSQKGRGIQFIELRITATAADVALDLGNFTGTFWSAVNVANTIGAAAVATIRDRISAQAVALLAVESPQLIDRVPVASLSGAGQYRIATITNALPNITVDTGDGETAWIIVLQLLLNDSIAPVNVA